MGVIHPSPVATNFYTGTHALPTLQLFKSTATGPDNVAEVLLRGLGRTVIIDQGYYPPALRLLLRVVELSWLTDIMVLLASTIDDYKYLKKAGDDARAATKATSAKKAH